MVKLQKVDWDVYLILMSFGYFIFSNNLNLKGRYYILIYRDGKEVRGYQVLGSVGGKDG